MGELENVFCQNKIFDSTVNILSFLINEYDSGAICKQQGLWLLY